MRLPTNGRMAELADAQDLKSCVPLRDVRVRAPLRLFVQNAKPRAGETPTLRRLQPGGDLQELALLGGVLHFPFGADDREVQRAVRSERQGGRLVEADELRDRAS